MSVSRTKILPTGLGILRFSSYQYHPHGKICLGSFVDFVDSDDSLLSNLSVDLLSLFYILNIRYL